MNVKEEGPVDVVAPHLPKVCLIPAETQQWLTSQRSTEKFIRSFSCPILAKTNNSIYLFIFLKELPLFVFVSVWVWNLTPLTTHVEALRSCIDVLKRRGQPTASAAPCWAAHDWWRLWVQPRQMSRWIGHHPEADSGLCPLTEGPSESSPRSGISSCFERMNCCLFYPKVQRIPLLPLGVKCCHEIRHFWCECNFVNTTW